WMQCVYDQKDAGFGLSKMDKQMTYRDAMYYDFLVNHEFQFPLGNVYNHDPIYGKEGTGMTKSNVTDEDFQNYLYMQSTRGITFWELLISDSLMSDEKYEVAGEFLEWAEENSHILRNAKIFGGMPDVTKLENGTSNEAQSAAYGFSCFDGNDGIISIRNPHSSQAKTVSFTFDRIIGVPEDAGTLKYYMVHDYRMPEGNSRTGEFTYGETYTFELQPNEVRMFQISKDGDTTAPVMERAFTDGDKTITVRFNEKVVGTDFTVSGATVESVAQSADNVTYRITLAEAPENKAELTVTANVTDISGNACTETISTIYNKGNLVTDSLQTDYGFSVKAEVAAADEAVLVSQGEAYALGINADGKAYFTVNGSTAVSDVAVTVPEGAETATIIGVKENNGIQKIYVNGTLAGSAYKADNRYFAVPADTINVAANVKASVYDIAFGYDELEAAEGPESNKIEGITGTASAYDANEGAAAENAFDGDYGSYFATPAGGNVADQYLIADLGTEYTIDQVNYTQRYDATQQYNCTGNLLNYVIEVSTDGETWTKVSEGATVAGTTEITFDPVAARYVKLTATESYHWQAANANTVMCVAELEVFKYVMPVYEPDDDSRDIPLSAVTVSTGDYEPDGIQYGEGPASLAVDNDPNTLWHTDWQGTSTENHWFQFELTESYKVDGLRYWPRQAGNTNGTITKYQILVSNDGENWTEVAAGDWENNRDWKIAQFDGQEVKYVRLQSVEAVSDNSWVFASASEIRITGTKVEGGTVEPPHEHEWSDWTVTKEATCTEDGEQTRTCGTCGETETEVIPALGHDWNEDGTCNNCGAVKPTESEKITGITGEGSSVDTSEPAFDKSVGNAFDGDYSTFWATVPGTLADAHLIADLGGTYTIDKVEYTKRYDSAAGYNCTGNLLDYIIEVSTDGETWTQVAAGATVDGTTEITFEAVEAAYVRLTATQSYHWQEANANTVMCVAELAVYGIPDGSVEPPHEHSWSDWTVTTEPTCTEAGVETRTCECGETETREVAALGHDFVDGVCTRCGEVEETPAENPFVDVNEDNFFYDSVMWAVENGVTAGVDATHFGPAADCGRAQVVTFLWRAAGSPEPTNTNNPFVDVNEGNYFYKAVLWAVEKGITAGVDDTHFGPTLPCTRAQVVTFLWRAVGAPEATGESTFTDVTDSGAYYYNAVLWAVENGVTAGMGDGTFGVSAVCNRAQVVTFLYHVYAE
ncbi:MAG: discoidin domain-containing protein, partial [Oscillospiraceae bacterium]|nr:discoidin domain-containing protein [Oscillospiraceae bacterium]